MLLVGGSVLFGIGGSTFGQLFAYTREFAEARHVDVTLFNSALRSVTSMTWIVGPPLGFLLFSRGSSLRLYLISAVLYTAAAAVSVLLLPETLSAGEQRTRISFGQTVRTLSAPVKAIILVIVLLLTVNSMYGINVALYVTETRGLPSTFAGLMIGLAAALEIPVMLLAGRFAERIGKQKIVFAAALCATAFFVAMPFADSPAALLALQLPNAIWTGVALSIPVVILQDALPNRAGIASALYSSAFKAGIFIGGLLVGTVAELVGFGKVFLVCAAFTAIAAAVLSLRRSTWSTH